jgi:hypothetical protein
MSGSDFLDESTALLERAEIIVRDGTSRAFEPFDRYAHVECDRGVPLPALIERLGELRAGRGTTAMPAPHPVTG